MSFLLFLFLSISCPDTEIINKSNESWNSRDQEEYLIVKDRCKVKFPQSPCLKRFIKRQPLTYHVICGKPSQ